MIRDDDQDLIYKTEDEKWNAVADDIIERNADGQPVLVGTVSIEKSERLSGVLDRRGDRPQRAQREEPREGGADRGPGGP